MKILAEVEPEMRVVVSKIMGGEEVKKILRELGISEGTELEVVAMKPIHIHAGPISLKVDKEEWIIAHGWADKIYVEKRRGIGPVSRLEVGEKGIVKTIEGGKPLENYLSELGIKKGKEIMVTGYLPDDTLVLRVEKREIGIGEGLASKVLVEKGGKRIQMNRLKEGEKARIIKTIGGTTFKEKLEQMGIGEGKEVVLLRKEVSAPTPRRGTYVVAKIGERLITIGYGLAEKVQVF